MRLILDTNVLVAAVRSRTGASNPLVIAGFQGRFRWCCSVPLFHECEDVLNRADFLLDAGIPQQDIGRLCDAIARTVEPVKGHVRRRPQLTDPADDMALEAAINGQACVVTHNRKDFAGAPARRDVEVLNRKRRQRLCREERLSARRHLPVLGRPDRPIAVSIRPRSLIPQEAEAAIRLSGDVAADLIAPAPAIALGGVGFCRFADLRAFALIDCLSEACGGASPRHQVCSGRRRCVVLARCSAMRMWRASSIRIQSSRKGPLFSMTPSARAAMAASVISPRDGTPVFR